MPTPSTRSARLCKAAGLSFAYHNHNIEFRKIGDAVPYDLLLQQTDPALVQMEMDIGWVVAGGADPVAYLTKYPEALLLTAYQGPEEPGHPQQ